MPLLSLSINTGFKTLAETVAQGMEADGGFTVTHTFDEDFHEDTEFKLKHVYVNVSGDGRGTSQVDRGENKEPALFVDVMFPDMVEDIIVSKKDTKRQRYTDTTPLTGKEFFPDTQQLVDIGQIRFPITTYPLDGVGVSTENSNRVKRASTTDLAARYEFRGTHICDIPLGRMKLKDNMLSVRFVPRDDEMQTMVDATPSIDKVRIRGISIILEYI